jgi:hypothetical protein
LIGWRWKDPCDGVMYVKGLRAALKRRKKTGISLAVVFLDVSEEKDLVLLRVVTTPEEGNGQDMAVMIDIRASEAGLKSRR